MGKRPLETLPAETFELSPEAQKKIADAEEWRNNPQFSDVPVGGLFPEERLPVTNYDG